MDQISSGCIRLIYQGAEPVQPVLQVMEVTNISGQSNQTNQEDRFMLRISDGIHFFRFMLSTRLTSLVREQAVLPGSIIRLCDYVCSDGGVSGIRRFGPLL